MGAQTDINDPLLFYRKSRADLNSMGMGLPNADETEKWITNGSVITTLTFLVFTVIATFFAFSSSRLAARVRNGDIQLV